MLGRESYFHGLTLYTVSFLRQSSKINGKRHPQVRDNQRSGNEVIDNHTCKVDESRKEVADV